MSRSDSEVFVESLLPRRHGYPLWIPEPHANLPPEYLAMGDSVGDVVTLTRDGGRDYLFNIFAEANNPINLSRVPSDFRPLSADPQDFLLYPDYHKSSTQISNFEAKKIAATGDMSANIPGTPTELCAGYEFKCTQSSGAAIVLPCGGSRVDFTNMIHIEKYIEENAGKWFEYVNGARGRGTRHLYLVTGCDKTSAWGVASYSSQSHSQEVCLKFITGMVGVSASYSWSASCNTPAAFRTSQPGLKGNNQCVFMRGFTITQKHPRLFSKSIGGIKIGDLCDSKPWKNSRGAGRWLGSPSSLAGSTGNRSQPSSNSSGSPSPSSSSQHSLSVVAPPSQWSPPNQESPPTFEEFERSPPIDNEQTIYSDSSSDSDNSCEDNLVTNTDDSYHPSKIINEYLLESMEDIAFAVTHDNQWCSLEMEKPEDICSRNALLQHLKNNVNSIWLSPKRHIASLKQVSTQEPNINHSMDDEEIEVPPLINIAQNRLQTTLESSDPDSNNSDKDDNRFTMSSDDPNPSELLNISTEPVESPSLKPESRQKSSTGSDDTVPSFKPLQSVDPVGDPNLQSLPTFRELLASLLLDDEELHGPSYPLLDIYDVSSDTSPSSSADGLVIPSWPIDVDRSHKRKEFSDKVDSDSRTRRLNSGDRNRRYKRNFKDISMTGPSQESYDKAGPWDEY